MWLKDMRKILPWHLIYNTRCKVYLRTLSSCGGKKITTTSKLQRVEILVETVLNTEWPSNWSKDESWVPTTNIFKNFSDRCLLHVKAFYMINIGIEGKQRVYFSHLKTMFPALSAFHALIRAKSPVMAFSMMKYLPLNSRTCVQWHHIQ